VSNQTAPMNQFIITLVKDICVSNTVTNTGKKQMRDMTDRVIDLQLSADQCAFLYEHYLKGILTDDEEHDHMTHAIEVMTKFKQDHKMPDSRDSEPEQTHYGLNLEPGIGPALSEREIGEVSYLVWIHAAIDKAMDQKMERGEPL
jgi:hypothetical protein